MRRVIRLGDSTSHGGKVVSATSHMIVGGVPVARLGDKCTCPKHGHNNCVIVEGDPNWTIDGVPVALEGHKISCGAVLISSMPNAGRVYDESGAGSSNQTTMATKPARDERFSFDVAPEKREFDQWFHVLDQDGNPLSDIDVVLVVPNGQKAKLQTDRNGRTPVVPGDEGDHAEIHFYGGE